MTSLSRYDTARAALAEAKTLDDVKEIHDKAEAMRVYARLAHDTQMEQDAAELRMRAKRRFGEMAAELKERGHLRTGPRPDRAIGAGEEPIPFTLADLGVTKKFSSQAQKTSGIAAQAFEMLVQTTRDRIAGGRSGAAPLNGHGAVAPTREEATDSLDFFPTPPWATRALIEIVLPEVGVYEVGPTVWEPACGEGHMAEVLMEYCNDVVATDIFDYGYGTVEDFLNAAADNPPSDWIITNPPFTGREDRALLFAKHAIDHASIGVALFVRSQWLVEGGERYQQLFKNTPPTLCAFFTERVPLHKGRYEPDGATMTAYSWVIWVKDEKPLPPFWIPPICRATLTKPNDAERFTAHPVKPYVVHNPETGEILEPSTEAA